MRKLTVLIVSALALVVGCNSVDPGKSADMVDVSGTVSRGGKPVTDVTLNLQPTAKGSTQAALPVKNGQFKGKVTPGKYTYFLSQASNASAFKAVPEKYREGSLERQIVIKGAGPVEFTFE